MPPDGNHLSGQRRTDDKRQRAPQSDPAVIHGDLFLPGRSQCVGQRHQRRKEQVETGNHQHQPAPAVTETEPDGKSQRQQCQQPQSRHQMRGILNPGSNQQTSEETRNQPGTEQNTDGFRGYPLAF